MAAASAAVRQDPDEFKSEFHRIVFMATEINRSRHPSRFIWRYPKLFLSGYFEAIEYNTRLLKCFRALPPVWRPPSPRPRNRDPDPEVYIPVYERDEGDPQLTTEELASFLRLLREIRISLDNSSIEATARYDILRLILCIVGVRFDMISRLLYYLYPPAGIFHLESFLEKPVDPRERYPNEHLILTLMYDTKGVMNQYQYIRYVTLWKKIERSLFYGRFCKKDSKEALASFTEMLMPYRELAQKLLEIPWPHLAQPAAGIPPPTESEEDD